MTEENKTCIKCECQDCKAKFDVWLDNTNRSSETEPEAAVIEDIKKNILMHCPVCKINQK